MKNNIIRILCKKGAEVTLVPWDYDLSEDAHKVGWPISRYHYRLHATSWFGRVAVAAVVGDGVINAAFACLFRRRSSSSPVLS